MHQEERQVGSYRLHKHLEHGIIADAYLATHIPTKKQVIVKVFQETMSEGHLAQCMASLHACARLEHPDILHLLDFGEESEADTNALFLVIDAPGETLRQRHPQGLPLPLDTIALYVSQIASALQVAHNQQVLHLDLSPERLFVGSDGRIMLDYTSRLLYSVAPTFIHADALYTPHEAPGPASDQYALATIIYEWLSGTLPFSNRAHEIADKRRTLPVPGEPVSIIWPRVEPVLSQALALDLTQRYENVQVFADTFIRALNVGPEAARLKQEIHRQLSFGRSASLTVGAAIFTTMGYQQTTTNWHNPFSSGFSFTTHGIHTLAFSPDSKRLAFNSYEPAIYVAEIAEQGTIFTYQGHVDPVWALAWSPDGQTIASISSNETAGDIQIWEVATGKLLSTYNVHPYARELQWSPDGKSIAIADYHTVQIWQPSTGKTLLTYSGHSSSVSSLAWSPDSTRIASAGQGGIHVCEVATGVFICAYRGHFGEINAIAWSPDGTMIASGGNDMTIQIWNAATRAPLFIHRLFSSTITAIGWSPDGKYIITGTHDNTIQACDVKDGKSVFSYHAHVMRTEHMSSIAWSPDLSILAIGGDDRRVEIANRANGKLLFCRAPAALIEEIGQSQVAQGEMMTMTNASSISTGQTTTTTITTTTTPPSGPPVVHTTTKQSRTVSVWGGKDARDTVTYFGHTSVVKPLAWSPDGSRIASSSAHRWQSYEEDIHRPDHEAMLHIWTATADPTAAIYGQDEHPVRHQDIGSITWSPDGQMIATQDLPYAQIYDTSTGEAMAVIMDHHHSQQPDKLLNVAWSPDGTRIAGSLSNGRVHVWPARAQSS